MHYDAASRDATKLMPEKRDKQETFEFWGAITPPQCEQLVGRANAIGLVTPPRIDLSTNYSDSPFSEGWAAIAVGSILRAAPNSDVIVLGATDSERSFLHRFVQTPPGLVASAMATNIWDHQRKPLALQSVLSEDIAETRGVFHKPNKALTLVELGGERAETLRRLADRTGDMAVAFTFLMSRMRERLELGWLDTSTNDDFNELLWELYDNAHRHGGTESAESRSVRFVHVRRIVGQSRPLLLRRAENAMPILRNHLHANTLGRRDALLEISVSDFGPGILDHFLASPAGGRTSAPRAEILEQLLFSSLTSQPLDPEAGKGLPKALRAARALRAFVSVRTGEFMYVASFAGNGEDFRLQRVEGIDAKVTGTHWHLVWSAQR